MALTAIFNILHITASPEAMAKQSRSLWAKRNKVQEKAADAIRSRKEKSSEKEAN